MMNARLSHALLVLFPLAAVAACSSSNLATPGATTTTTSSSSSSSSGTGAGGGSSSSGGAGGAGASLLDPPPAGQGIQYKMVSTLDAGQEIERVQFFQVPPEGLYVNREEVRFTQGSHHVLIYSTPYKSIPTVDIHGNTVDTSGVIDAPNGGTADWNINGVIAGAQSANTPPIVDGLPADTAVTLPGGTVLLMNTHYLNTASTKVEVEARVNMWTIPKEAVKQEAGILFYYDPIIRVPAQTSGYSEMSCPVMADITIVNLQTHEHRRGVGGAARVLPASGSPVDVYTSTSWESVPVKHYAPNLQVKAGSWIDYHCDYENTQSNTVLQGLSTKDEMCMLIGVYYPRDAKTELCSPDGSFDHLSEAGTWMGKGGTADCPTSVGCALSANGDDATYACVLGACPAAAKPLNDALKCMQGKVDGCSSSCASDADQTTCVTNCLEQACPNETLACGAAACN